MGNKQLPRQFTVKKLVVASHNKGKVAEIKDLLAPYPLEILSISEFGLSAPEETGKTFIDNAQIKAQAAVEGCGLPCLADDSGISVEALCGEPGIFSARWAGPDRNFNLAMTTVNAKLGDKSNRRAYFVSALTLAWPDGHSESFEGRIYGTMVWPPRGSSGFGYDPMFMPDGYNETFGEIPYDVKQRISHRAMAFEKLINGCFQR